MKHIKTMSATARVPEKAMSASQILVLIGTIFTTIGPLLITISGFIGPKESN